MEERLENDNSERLVLEWLDERIAQGVEPDAGFVRWHELGSDEARFLREHGKFYARASQPRPSGVLKGPNRHGYMNAGKRMLYEGERYVEGVALHPTLGVVLAHAWNANAQGRVIDPTWEALGGAYFGFEPSLWEFAARIQVNDTWGPVLPYMLDEMHESRQEGENNE